MSWSLSAHCAAFSLANYNVCAFYWQVIKSVFSAWTPSFINLTKLELTADCCFLSKFLEIANNLEILKVCWCNRNVFSCYLVMCSLLANVSKTFLFCMWTCCCQFHDQTEYQINSQHPLDELTIGWIEPQQVPKCLLSRLSTIKIVKTVGTKHGLEIIRYLLRNAKVLNRMDITYPPCIDSEEKNELLQKISLFERGSKTCELVFTEVSSEDCEWDWEGIAPLGLTFWKSYEDSWCPYATNNCYFGIALCTRGFVNFFISNWSRATILPRESLI